MIVSYDLIIIETVRVVQPAVSIQVTTQTLPHCDTMLLSPGFVLLLSVNTFSLFRGLHHQQSGETKTSNYEYLPSVGQSDNYIENYKVSHIIQLRHKSS